MNPLATVWAIILGVVLVVSIFATYHRAEDRKAYYACLALTQKLAEQQKQPDGSVRIVSLPYCRI